MLGSLTRSQVVILLDAQSNEPGPPAGRRPRNYARDVELLMFMKLMTIRAGVLSIADDGSAYLRAHAQDAGQAVGEPGAGFEDDCADSARVR